MVSMAVLFVVPLPLVRSVALGGILAVANALFGALVLLPALLAWLGPNVNRFAIGRAPEQAGPSRAWAAIGEFANRHPWLTAGGCTVVLVLAALPALRMRAAIPDATTFPRGSEVRSVDERIADPAQFDPSGSSALQIVLETDGPVLAPETLRRIQAYLATLAAVPGIVSIDTALDALDPSQVGGDGLVTTTDPDVLTELGRTVDDDLTLINAQGAAGVPHPRRRAAGRGRARAAAPGPAARGDRPDRDGGRRERHALALRVDRRARRGGLEPRRAVRGVPLRARADQGRAHERALARGELRRAGLGVPGRELGELVGEEEPRGPLRFEPPNGIEPTIPLMLAAIVFGLSMDYEVFLLSRIQEEYRQHGDNQRSIVAGLAHTGRVISSAALILLVVIGAFAAGELVFVKEIGVGMSAAIALDVTLVRALLVPATMRLLGRWNWWAPRWLAWDGGSPSVPPYGN